MSFSFRSTGDYKQFEKFLKRMSDGDLFKDLDRFGRMGVDALASATPLDTGETASSWGYKVTNTKSSAGIQWYNTNDKVAILLQYGHGTGTGGYVQGKDYINPAIQPIFDKIADDVWKKVKNG